MVSGASNRTTFASVPQDSRINPRFSACAKIEAVSSASGSLVLRILDQLESDHRAQTAHIADARKLLRECFQARMHFLSDTRRPRAQVFGFDHIEHRMRGCDADRIAAVCSSQPSAVRGIHDGCAPGHPGEREAASQALGNGNEIGHDAGMLDREHLAGPCNAALHFVGNQHDAMLVAHGAQRPQEFERRDVEAALALHRLDDDGRHRLRIDIAVE